ncbi:hypothetical protein UY3_12733 [Chelonia mydas]|uniref:Uncharacterized protein n=1 Tax=Chelonia mydas TaxID=8469 RepID=M7B3S8_CHEMY|nr:hypothetical protein UY3_12733 [Chelonia mydas]
MPPTKRPGRPDLERDRNPTGERPTLILRGKSRACSAMAPFPPQLAASTRDSITGCFSFTRGGKLSGMRELAGFGSDDSQAQSPRSHLLPFPLMVGTFTF